MLIIGKVVLGKYESCEYKIEEDKNIVLEWISGNEAPEGIFLSQIKNYLTSKKISN